MNNANDPTPSEHHRADDRHAAEREEVLIGRVVDHEATPDDWSELERLADAEPMLWTRLARAERAHARLSAAVDDAIAIAECVDLPRAARPSSPAPRHSRSNGWHAGIGWAVAACLALVLGVQAITPNQTTTAPHAPSQAGTPGAMLAPLTTRPSGVFNASMQPSGDDTRGVMHFANYSPEDLWSGYVRRGAVEGRVLREMPSMVVEIRPLEGDDEYELLIERRVLERRVVSSKDTPVMRIYMDEYGEPVAVPVDPEDGLSRLLGPRESPV